jgi:hypothetical protein
VSGSVRQSNAYLLIVLTVASTMNWAGRIARH